MSYDRRTLASDSPFAVGAALLMILAAILMLAILPQRLTDADMGIGMTLLPLLPSAACICTAVMLVSRKNSLVPTALPVGAVCLYAAAHSFGDALWVTLVFCLIGTALAALYLLAVAGTLSSRTPLLAVSTAAAVWTLVTLPRLAGGGSAGAVLAGFAPALIYAALFLIGCGMRRGRLY